VINSRSSCTGHWPVHLFSKLNGAAAGLMLAAAPLAFVLPAPASAATVAAPSGQTLDDFYRLRKDAPLWLSPAAGNSAEQLISLLSTSSIDGLSPDKYHVATLQAALDEVLADISALGGTGGLIAVAPSGETAWGFTTRAMYRGMANPTDSAVAIYADEAER